MIERKNQFTATALEHSGVGSTQERADRALALGLKAERAQLQGRINEIDEVLAMLPHFTYIKIEP